MNVVGIDFSSRFVDIVTVHLDDAHSPLWNRYPLHGNDAFERTRSVAQAVPGPHTAYWDDVLAVGIEHPAGRYGTGPLMRLQGAILACIPARMLVEPLPPAKWRKLVGLPGNATKDEVAARSSGHLFGLYAQEDAPIVISRTALHTAGEWPQDAHDAHLIALATRTLLEREKAA